MAFPSSLHVPSHAVAGKNTVSLNTSKVRQGKRSYLRAGEENEAAEV
jgi:hypothetical protein